MVAQPQHRSNATGRTAIRSGARLALAAVLAVPVLAVPALADVKAGVEAWSRGDYAAAIREWQGPADKGDADAEFDLGQAYKLGKGVPQDLSKAEALFARAAAQGHLAAADNYGFVMYQRGEHEQAMPYIRAAADRGEPRAEYLLGIAHFNGENAPKDWVRAYALETLAQQAGLPQAKVALGQMDSYIPIEQRQQGVAMATDLASKMEANRARQLAAQDLGSGVTAPPAEPSSAPVPPQGALAVADTPPIPAPRVTAPHMAPPRPAASDAQKPAAPHPAAHPAEVAAAAPSPAHTAGGQWRLQLGAFGVAANAEAMWNRVKALPEVAGHPRLLVPTGAVNKLQAGGYSQEGAQAACRRLTGAGFTCIAVKG